MEQTRPREPPLTVWIVTLNRQVHREECALCTRYIDPDSQEKANRLTDRSEAFRYVMARLLPALVMRNRHCDLPPSQWHYSVTRSGKDYIDSPDANKVLGYSTGWAESLVAMAYAHGRKSQVVNIGIDVMQLALPRGVPARKFIEAFTHKLTKTEESLLDRRLNDDVILRRLCILLTIKTAYIKALGQPPGFDFSRIDCNIPEETIKVDGRSLGGWEFRLFKANLGVVRKGLLIEETYQCSTAVYRGWDETRFIWEEDEKEMANWVHFITTDTVLGSLTSPPRTDSKSVTP
ncbi:hypothetical protein JB92DRAFT_3113358 [Gautieria morchelliformis]|nr:hypothetical protein JB92DRAFT_3113358 [Gautieria morchelliformis]